MIYAAQTTVNKPGDRGTAIRELHPGEYGRVGAWVKRTKRSVAMERDKYGYNPAVVFEKRAPMFKTVPTVPTPQGFEAPDHTIGQGYIIQKDGTPVIKRTINFTPAASDGNETTVPAVLQSLQVPNEKYIDDDDWLNLKKWVHNYFVQRIPEEHMHLVEDVRTGNLEELLVRVFGLATRDPEQYVQTIKAKMKANGAKLTVTGFNLVGYQWLLDQEELFDTIMDAECSDVYKMPETEFSDMIILTLDKFIPTFCKLYTNDRLKGDIWSKEELKERLQRMAARGELRVEPAIRQAHDEKKPPQLTAAQKTEMKWFKDGELTGYLVDDHSKHDYTNDAHWEEDEVKRDGEPRYDASGYLGGGYGQDGYQWSSPPQVPKGGKGKGGAYPYGKGKGGYGKGGDGKGKGSKGDWKGGKGAKGDWYGKGKGGKGSKGSKGGKGDDKGSKGGKSSNKRWSEEGGYTNDWGAEGGAEGYYRELKCTVCEWWGKPWRIVSRHEKATCRMQGGDMEGYEIWDCLQEQRRLNEKFYEEQRKKEEAQWYPEGAPAAKAARVAEAEDTKEAASEEAAKEPDEANGDAEIFERWYGMHTQMIRISIDSNLLDDVSPAATSIEVGARQNHARYQATTDDAIPLGNYDEFTDADKELHDEATKMHHADEELRETNTSETVEYLKTVVSDGAITTANIVGNNIEIADDEGAVSQLQMDSGCCGMSMINDPNFFPYGLTDGKVIRVHTAEKDVVRTAEQYGVAAGSVPTILDIDTRMAGPRKAIRTGLAVCDSRIHNLLNENRFDINLDGSNTPHRVDKKNRCVWMYEGTRDQIIIPLEYNHDALFIDYRPLTTKEQVQFVRQNPLATTDWHLGNDIYRLRTPAQEVLQVRRQDSRA